MHTFCNIIYHVISDISYNNSSDNEIIAELRKQAQNLTQNRVVT